MSYPGQPPPSPPSPPLPQFAGVDPATLLRQHREQELKNKSTWWSWSPFSWWSGNPVQPLKSGDAIRNPVVQIHFSHYLDNTDPPKTFKASQVAKLFRYSELQAMGFENWMDVMEGVIEFAFEMRSLGYCEILLGGKVLGDDVGPMDIKSDVTIRRCDD